MCKLRLTLFASLLIIIRRQEFRLRMPPANFGPGLFEYSSKELMELEVCRILRNPREQIKKGEISNPHLMTTGNGKKFRINAGYRTVLLGLLREVEFESVDQVKSAKCNFRAHYLVKVLDAFAAELNNPGDRKRLLDEKPYHFRSKVLNPLLQRQMRGVSDNSPDEVEKAVGRTDDDAHVFYHGEDPLAPEGRKLAIRNLLYVPSVRLSFLVLYSQCTNKYYAIIHKNTELMRAKRLPMEAEGAWDHSILDDLEIETIKREGFLVELFQKLIEASVCAVFFCSVHFLRLLKESGGCQHPW